MIALKFPAIAPELDRVMFVVVVVVFDDANVFCQQQLKLLVFKVLLKILGVYLLLYSTFLNKHWTRKFRVIFFMSIPDVRTRRRRTCLSRCKISCSRKVRRMNRMRGT